MFKSRSITVKNGIFYVYNVIMKIASLSTFHKVQFSDIMTNRIVTDFLVLPVDIRYNVLPSQSNY
jgi:ABC-type transporter MlaC component